MRERQDVKSKVDRMIDWLAVHRPDSHGPITLAVRRRTAMRFARPEERGGPLTYRGFPIHLREPKRTRRGAQQEI